MNTDKLYDIIIIGAGPAGITASIYAARKRMEVVVITKDIGGQAAWSGDIENYTGYQFVSGPELASKFEEHIKKYNVQVNQNECVYEVRKEQNTVLVKSEKNTYRAKTAIIASGKKTKLLRVPGEKEFKNKGLTYCATCDGPLFAGKDVAVIGGGNSAMDAAIQLVKIANKVYIIDIAPKLDGDPVLRDNVMNSDNLVVMSNSRVTAILGDDFVSSIKVISGGEEKEIGVQGIFVEIGLSPNSELAPDLKKNDKGEIKVNCQNETDTPGLYAAGDVTDVPEKQIIIAAGDGAKACLSAFRYISKKVETDWGKAR